MNLRLLSFLCDFQNAVLADNPAMDDMRWEMQRTVNYQLGLARLKLALGSPGHTPLMAGEVLVQSFSLAEGASCVKAVLRWTDSKVKLNRAVYEREDTDWKREARKIAADWNAGAPAETPALTGLSGEEPLKPLVEQAG